MSSTKDLVLFDDRDEAEAGLESFLLSEVEGRDDQVPSSRSSLGV